MWVITHVFAGLAIAAAVGWPWWLVLVLVLLSHVVMDLVPHWDYSSTQHPVFYGFLDFGAGLVVWLVCWLGLGMPFWMALMGPVSGAPDWDVLIAEIRRKPETHYFPSHSQRVHGHSGPVWGIGVQVAIMVAGAAVVLALQPF